MKFALIGMGRIAVNHVSSVMVHEKTLDLCAVCDLIPERMDETLQKAGCAKNVNKYTDYKAMIDEQQPDLVAITTDSGSHAEIGRYCLEHGCHLIIEKPMAMSMADARMLIDLAQKHKRVLSACHQNRFNKSVQQIRSALDSGRFGKLSHMAAHVRWNRGESYYQQAPWRGTWAGDGGCLLNQCIHNADLMVWMLGDIEEVFAYTANQQHPYIEGEDLGLAVVKSKRGAYGVFEGTVNAIPTNLEETLYVFGDQGTVKAAGTSVNLIEEWRFIDGVDDAESVKRACNETPPYVYGFGHQHLYGDVIRAIETKTKPLVSGEDGLKALEFILAIYKSKKTGLPVRLPLDDFASTDMVGMFGREENF